MYKLTFTLAMMAMAHSTTCTAIENKPTTVSINPTTTDADLNSAIGTNNTETWANVVITADTTNGTINLDSLLTSNLTNWTGKHGSLIFKISGEYPCYFDDIGGQPTVLLPSGNYRIGKAGSTFVLEDEAKMSILPPTVLDVYHGYESTFYRTAYDIGSGGDDTVASVYIDDDEVLPLIRNPVDGRSYTITYGAEGSTASEAFAIGQLRGRIPLSGAQKVKPTRPSPHGTPISANPTNFATQLALVDSFPSSTIVELQLASGTYPHGLPANQQGQPCHQG